MFLSLVLLRRLPRFVGVLHAGFQCNPHPDTFPTPSLTVTPAPTIHPHGHLLCPGLPYPHHSPLATTPPTEEGEKKRIRLNMGLESWPRAAKPGGSVGCAVPFCQLGERGIKYTHPRRCVIEKDPGILPWLWKQASVLKLRSPVTTA